MVHKMKNNNFAFVSLCLAEISFIYAFFIFRPTWKSSESESGGEELADLEEEDAVDREELQEGMSDMYRNLLCIKHGHPASSTPFSKPRDPPAFCAPKRRRLITAANVHSHSVSPPSVSISLSSFRPVSPDPVSPS